jgi:biopolymer transport protein TolR
MAWEINRNKKSMMSDINVTPFVDVVLVLLVIFMVTAPLMYSNINLQLPQTKKVQRYSPKAKQIILSLDQMGEIYVGKEKLLSTEVIDYLKKKMGKNLEEIIYIRAHKDLPYGQVAKIFTQLKMNGLSNLALITEVDTKL